MPRFFFHLVDGVNPPDAQGTELPDPAEACREAVRLAGEIAACTPHRLRLGEDWYLEVADDRGGVLLRFEFHPDGASDRIEPRP